MLLRGFLELRRPWGFSPEARRGTQGASRAAPGKSGLHARGEGERVMALESREGTRASRRVEEGLSRSFSGGGGKPSCRRLRGRGCANCQSLPQAELFVRQRERPGLHSHWVWKIPWSRKWQPLRSTFLLGKSHGQRSLVGYSPHGRKESDMTERLTHTYSTL